MISFNKSRALPLLRSTITNRESRSALLVSAVLVVVVTAEETGDQS
jgi:hypothetical protein